MTQKKASTSSKKPKIPSTNLEGKKPRKPGAKIAKGEVLNPEGKGGFQERPQDRSDGRWDKEQSISYQYNKLMRLAPKDFNKFKPQTVAQQIAHKRIMIARTNTGLYDTKEITDRTEGKAPQFIGLGDSDEFKERIGATIVFEENPEAENSNTVVS